MRRLRPDHIFQLRVGKFLCSCNDSLMADYCPASNVSWSSADFLDGDARRARQRCKSSELSLGTRATPDSFQHAAARPAPSLDCVQAVQRELDAAPRGLRSFTSFRRFITIRGLVRLITRYIVKEIAVPVCSRSSQSSPLVLLIARILKLGRARRQPWSAVRRGHQGLLVHPSGISRSHCADGVAARRSCRAGPALVGQ
jgi:hypothetical protein